MHTIVLMKKKWNQTVLKIDMSYLNDFLNDLQSDESEQIEMLEELEKISCGSE